MHDIDTASPSLQPASQRVSPPHLVQAPRREAVQAHEAKAGGLFKRLLTFLAGFLRRKKQAGVYVPDAEAAERMATARAAQMPPPMAFKGDTANTLATPMSAYAGKPVEQALRKRAEQQFKNFDITQTTMH